MLQISKTPIRAIHHRFSSKRSFTTRLERIEQDFRVTRKIPLIHIETHGHKHGIGPSDNNGITWPELFRALVPLNAATGLRLLVFLSACEGIRGIKMAQ